ncbi:hypothetical protein ACQPYK_11270 [Streptosporangium sp. CA-135522]|uniref:hypothetical protein n=1 Tax=Streptosporangium sp. CA-135522 TaxID=3240072 RepID=UPI003D92299D
MWSEDGRETTHPADDPVGTARLISRHYRRPAPGGDPFDHDPFEERMVSRAHASPPTDSARD